MNKYALIALEHCGVNATETVLEWLEAWFDGWDCCGVSDVDAAIYRETVEFCQLNNLGRFADNN